MPPKKVRFGPSKKAQQMKRARASESDDMKSKRRIKDAERHAASRALESQEQADVRRRLDAQRKATERESEIEEETERRRRLNTQRTAAARESEVQEETERRRILNTQRTAAARRSEVQEETERRRRLNSQRTAAARQSEIQEETEIRRTLDAQRTAAARQLETQESANTRRVTDRNRHRNFRLHPFTAEEWKKAAFNYIPNYAYDSQDIVTIGSMSILCSYCDAKKWSHEPPSLCCSKGKIKLPLLTDPPQPLKNLLLGSHPDSKHFLRNIQHYNNAFMMTSFGANIVSERGFMPTFKIQGQIHHRIGSLLASENEESQYLQVYFIGGQENQAKVRCNRNQGVKEDLILSLQEMLHTNNAYIRSFKAAIEKTSVSEFQVVINADKKPSNEHSRRFNLPQCNEVAIIMTDENFGKRDIIINSRDSTLKRVCETHRSYDSLQYPLLFVYGEDGYHFFIPQFGNNPRKYVSCMDFYAYHFMIRDNSFNLLHRSQNLFHQFAVDMFAKIEAERLLYIKTHQKELRVDSYIHLRDHINNDGQGRSLGQICILPSSFTGSPRYMHERTQDAMTYVRKYGKPDLFITFTSNPKWKEIQDELLPGQTYVNRPDLLARVFRLKVMKLMHLINKSQIFGKVRCYMYTIEWQKRGLPHVHILIWLETKINSNQIDSLISAELPNPDIDPTLFEIVKSHMVHGPCGNINCDSPCMVDGKC